MSASVGYWLSECKCGCCATCLVLLATSMTSACSTLAWLILVYILSYYLQEQNVRVYFPIYCMLNFKISAVLGLLWLELGDTYYVLVSLYG